MLKKPKSKKRNRTSGKSDDWSVRESKRKSNPFRFKRKKTAANKGPKFANLPKKKICSNCKRLYGGAIDYCKDCDKYSVRPLTSDEQRMFGHRKIRLD